jgi:hypothetical protein
MRFGQPPQHRVWGWHKRILNPFTAYKGPLPAPFINPAQTAGPICLYLCGCRLAGLGVYKPGGFGTRGCGSSRVGIVKKIYSFCGFTSFQVGKSRQGKYSSHDLHIPDALGWEWLPPHHATHQRQTASVVSGLPDCMRLLGDSSLYARDLAGVTGLRLPRPQRSR